jgi:peptidyl-prolyl cis-trans isomerase SurA
MNKEGGVYTVPCKINGLPLKFIFDTGASDVSISLTEAMFMLKNGYLQKEDIGEEIYYSIANGDVSKGTQINIREVEFGGLKLYNIDASIVHENSAPLLLGQSVIEKLGKIQIEGTELTIINGKNVTYDYSRKKNETSTNNSDDFIKNDNDRLLYNKYLRLKKEINASHILISLDEKAKPSDTLAAYNKINRIYKKILKGENFENLVLEYSEDPSAKQNKGCLGYFSAFRMVVAFENAAYKTQVGSVSVPIRTRFGYHLIKVNDMRENKGEVLVAHIMILKNNNNLIAENSIQEIYNKLLKGENFEYLAEQYSEDKSSAKKGGVLNKFSSGQLISEKFENESFSLKEIGSFTEPFETDFGWHIVKLIEKYPIKPFTEMKLEILEKIIEQNKLELSKK